MRFSRLVPGLILLVAVTVISVAPAAEEGKRHFELGIEGGFFLPDDDLSGKPRTIDELESLGGVRLGYFFANRWDVYFDALIADVNTNRTVAGDVDSQAYRAGIEYLFKPHWKKSQWYVGLGGGLVDYTLENEPSFDRTFGSISFGQRYRLDRRALFRWELRGDQTFGDEGIGGSNISRAQALIGVHWGLGIGHPDSDGDGVPDNKDECPDTPKGAIVDKRGCPLDSDGDGVYDGIDECPDTPRGATVDAVGCPSDSDGDGVYDGIDECPNTPRGATVDARGCPRDSDGDGVLDGIDQCPNTPRGAIVDARGCPLDGDGDGVYDGIDECPNTPRGTPVKPNGCPRAAPLFEEEEKILVLEGVLFEFDKAVLTPNSKKILDRVAQSLKDWPRVRVEIGGHTDHIGSEEYNENLSERRAQSVMRYLIGKGVGKDRLWARGYGESRPVADNKTKAGRDQNRRVELTRLD